MKWGALQFEESDLQDRIEFIREQGVFLFSTEEILMKADLGEYGGIFIHGSDNAKLSDVAKARLSDYSGWKFNFSGESKINPIVNRNKKIVTQLSWKLIQLNLRRCLDAINNGVPIESVISMLVEDYAQLRLLIRLHKLLSLERIKKRDFVLQSKLNELQCDESGYKISEARMIEFRAKELNDILDEISNEVKMYGA